MGRDQHARRLRGDRGSALVEAAIILPFLALLIFGIVEIGFLLRSATITSSATRSGARLAAAQYGGAQDAATQQAVLAEVRHTVEKDLQSRGGTDEPQELWIYKAEVDGNPIPADFSSCTANCIVFTWSPGNAAFNPIPTGSWPAPDACGVAIDSVGIWLRVTHTPLGFSSVLGDIDIREKTVMRLEPRNDCATPEL